MWPSSWSHLLLSLFKVLLEAEDTQIELGFDYRAKITKEEEQKAHRFSSSLVENCILERWVSRRSKQGCPMSIGMAAMLVQMGPRAVVSADVWITFKSVRCFADVNMK